MIITLYTELKDGRLRYYTLHDRQLSLDRRYTLTVARRTENAAERERFYTFDSAREMDGKLKELFTRAVRRGYRLLYCFDREGFGRFGAQDQGSRVAGFPLPELKVRARA